MKDQDDKRNLDPARVKLMLEMFVTILPIHEIDEKARLAPLLGGIDPAKILYALQYDLFSQMYLKKGFKELDDYFQFLIEAIAYARGQTPLFPDVPNEIVAEFENRKIVIDKMLAKKEAKKAK